MAEQETGPNPGKITKTSVEESTDVVGPFLPQINRALGAVQELGANVEQLAVLVFSAALSRYAQNATDFVVTSRARARTPQEKAFLAAAVVTTDVGMVGLVPRAMLPLLLDAASFDPAFKTFVAEMAPDSIPALLFLKDDQQMVVGVMLSEEPS